MFPNYFTAHLTEKDQEVIASPARFRNQAIKGKSAKTLARADYQEKMAAIFAECRRVVKDAGIMRMMFNHKSTTAWDAITVALINARFALTRTWPVQTEAESSMHIKGKAAARTTILLVCRPREANPFPKPWHEVEQLIARAVQDDIRDNLSQADLKPIDLYLSAFGPALRVISEHWSTERESANPARPEAPFTVTPTEALLVARREVSQHRAREISREWADKPMDAASKFYILAKDATENDTLLFDEANLLARAIGVPLNQNDAALVYLTFSTGVGGGIVDRGVVFTGAAGAAGEVGHMTIDARADSPACSCDNNGCLEALTAGTAIGRAAQARRSSRLMSRMRR